MRQIEDLTGKTFARWTVLSLAPERRYKQACWLCRCECGTERVLLGAHLRIGATKSCGCLRREVSSASGRAKIRDLTGMKFGRLQVIERVGVPGDGRRPRYRCLCDCGKETMVVANGLTFGKTKSCGCLKLEGTKERSGERHYNWKGGRQRAAGYIRIREPDHPNANAKGLVLEHIVVMSRILGRPLRAKETVHHKNGIRHDNRPENLELWASKHIPGQRVSDLIAFAKSLLLEYCSPEELAEWLRVSVEATTTTLDSVS